jgi:hypothetical protein
MEVGRWIFVKSQTGEAELARIVDRQPFIRNYDDWLDFPEIAYFYTIKTHRQHKFSYCTIQHIEPACPTAIAQWMVEKEHFSV